MRRNRPILLAALAAALLPLGLGGCSEASSAEPTMEQRQNAAMADPFSYGPNNANAGSAAPGRPTPPPAIKPTDESLNGEWKRFWNP